jgi:hypothetical protein
MGISSCNFTGEILIKCNKLERAITAFDTAIDNCSLVLKPHLLKCRRLSSYVGKSLFLLGKPHDAFDYVDKLIE